jgi:hypothetical protein
MRNPRHRLNLEEFTLLSCILTSTQKQERLIIETQDARLLLA